MNTRLKQIIDYKTGGKQTAFAALMGWTPQYLSKLLHGENFGIQPVISLLTVLPEVDARWLLIGDGNMLMSHSSLRKEIIAHIDNILDLERYLPYMQPDELHRFEQAVASGCTPNFSPETVADWRAKAAQHDEEINQRFADACTKSDQSCKQ